MERNKYDTNKHERRGQKDTFDDDQFSIKYRQYFFSTDVIFISTHIYFKLFFLFKNVVMLLPLCNLDSERPPPPRDRGDGFLSAKVNGRTSIERNTLTISFELAHCVSLRVNTNKERLDLISNPLLVCVCVRERV